MVRSFASEVGGAGSNPGRVIPKTLKMVQVAISINKASTGFSSLKKITSVMGAPCNTLYKRCLEYLADSDSSVPLPGISPLGNIGEQRRCWHCWGVCSALPNSKRVRKVQAVLSKYHIFQ